MTDGNETVDQQPKRSPIWWTFWTEHLGAFVLCGLLIGVVAGLFFGEYCSFLSIVGDAFVGLLRMTVLPYIATTLIANLGRQSLGVTRHLAMCGGLVMLGLWAVVITTIFLLPSALPPSDSGSFYSSALVDPATGKDMLSVFIPANIFAALANNHVPAIIVFCVCVGAALATVPERQTLIAQLDVIAAILIRVAAFIAKLAPIGIFAIAASTVGTVTLSEIGRLQAYLVIYCCGALSVGFVLLPLLVTSLTSLEYRQVLRIVREPMLTAFATGKLIIVLPLLIENTERMLAQTDKATEQDKHELEVLYATAYAFPHAGKLLSMVFIPFASWFLGNEMSAAEYPSLLFSGVFAYFGGPIIAVPFLLNQMRLPHDMFQLFLFTGVIGERVGDALGAIHLAAFALLTLYAMRGTLDIRPSSVVKFFVVSAICLALTLSVARGILGQTTTSVETKSQVIARMQLIERPADSTVIMTSAPNPVPCKPGETIIERIRRRGVMRIGFNEDKLPFAFLNEQGELVGFDINLAHALALDLGVQVEFVHFDRATLAEQVHDDDFDFVMSGLVGTLERSEAMQHSDSYMDVTLGLVVPDHRVREFRSLTSIREIDDLQIGFVDLSRGFVARLKQVLPEAQLVELKKNFDYFERPDLNLDALLISAESGSAFTLMFPEHEVAVPRELDVKLPLFYAIAGNDTETRDFLDHWVELRKKDGTFDDYYRHWILGETPQAPQPRWSVIRDVLHWVP